MSRTRIKFECFFNVGRINFYSNNSLHIVQRFLGKHIKNLNALSFTVSKKGRDTSRNLGELCASYDTFTIFHKTECNG